MEEAEDRSLFGQNLRELSLRINLAVKHHIGHRRNRAMSKESIYTMRTFQKMNQSAFVTILMELLEQQIY